MPVVDHGIFTRYTPDNPLLLGDKVVLYLKNAAGVDFYALTAELPEGATLVEIFPDTGNVFGFTGRDGPNDYRTIWPDGRQVLEVRPARTDLAGKRWTGTGWEDAPPPIPPIVSRVQLAQGFAEAVTISEAEAEAWVADSVLPAALVGFVGGLPADAQFAARLKLRGSQVFAWGDPLVDAMLDALVPGDKTDFWRYCAAF